MEGRCYCCGKAGHRSPECNLRTKTPQEKWAINTAKINVGNSHAQVESKSKSEKDTASTAGSSISSKTTDNKDNTVGWFQQANMDLQFFQNRNDEIRTWILLDSESSTSLMCNPKYVRNIRKAKKIMNLRTNGGNIISNQECDVPQLFKTWFNEEAVTNILSFAEVSDHYRITYDNKNGVDEFKVHLKGGKTIPFVRSENNLYFYKPSTKDVLEGNIFLNTLEENKEFHTEREFKRAKRAREFFHAMGSPSIPDLMAILCMNLVGRRYFWTRCSNFKRQDDKKKAFACS